MAFNYDRVIRVLEQTAPTLDSMLSSLPGALTDANEGPNTWSAFDIMGHLIHGEKTDWIPRIEIILFAEDKQFEPFDRFAQERESVGKNLTELRQEFRDLRDQNLVQLESLNLDQKHFALQGIHPEFGAVSISQLLSAWAAHDLGHIYQVSRVIAKQFKEDSGPWPRYLRVLTD